MEKIEIATRLLAALITEPMWGEDSEPVFRMLTTDVDEDYCTLERRLAIAARKLTDALADEIDSPSVPYVSDAEKTPEAENVLMGVGVAVALLHHTDPVHPPAPPPETPETIDLFIAGSPAETDIDNDDTGDQPSALNPAQFPWAPR